MANKLDHPKASRRLKARRAEAENRRAEAEQNFARGQMRYSDALRAFAQKHGITCFKCGDEAAPPAKCGTNRRGPWVICVHCIQAARQG
jgi:hypothetical protein